mmetsp:Transcript_32512/g.76388  ORF Transcript_32512/g.76388 Transcript_32512/m.76388 type:complete len:201 (+) Transcript_32512:1078-1680(+)
MTCPSLYFPGGGAGYGGCGGAAAAAAPAHPHPMQNHCGIVCVVRAFGRPPKGMRCWRCCLYLCNAEEQLSAVLQHFHAAPAFSSQAPVALALTANWSQFRAIRMTLEHPPLGHSRECRLHLSPLLAPLEDGAHANEKCCLVHQPGLLLACQRQRAHKSQLIHLVPQQVERRWMLLLAGDGCGVCCGGEQLQPLRFPGKRM